MKFYVDELPKCCEECDLRAENDIGCGYCAVKEYYEDTPKAYETCPLQTLAEHDKQVRKEVCDEIKDRFFAICQIELGNDMLTISLENFVNILDQIKEGGDNDTNKQ